MPRFVIQKHHASRLHYDLRLEMDGVLKSWAVPKEPTADTKVKRLAISVEDHDLDYADFEGEREEGQYGAGKVEVWDAGEYDLIERTEGFIRFNLRGKKLSGPWKLIHTNYKPGDNWLLAASRGATEAGAHGAPENPSPG
jgi:DNA ligase D-like protein (predicted 3'-phosphoesterase)